MAVLAQTSWVPASGLARLGLASMAERGRVQRGAVADLVVFDPNTVTDHSTYANGNQLATGFKAVLVAGELIVEDDREKTDKTPGQAIRFSGSGP
jgi:N-acyl-D-glutamate deacylase